MKKRGFLLIMAVIMLFANGVMADETSEQNNVSSPNNEANFLKVINNTDNAFTIAQTWSSCADFDPLLSVNIQANETKDIRIWRRTSGNCLLSGYIIQFTITENTKPAVFAKMEFERPYAFRSNKFSVMENPNNIVFNEDANHYTLTIASVKSETDN